MSSNRWNSAAVMLLGAVWALVLVASGWGATAWSSPPPYLSTTSVRLGGLTMIAMGQFVFLAVVCDRLFPDSGRTVAAGEVISGGAFLALGAATGLSVLIGAND